MQRCASRAGEVLLSAAQCFTVQVGGMYNSCRKSFPWAHNETQSGFRTGGCTHHSSPAAAHLCHQKLSLGIGGRQCGAQVAALPLLGVSEAGPGAVPHDAVIQKLALMRGVVAEQGIPMGG